jgi:hypothetical protein
VIFALAETTPAFMASVALLASGRALISGSLEAWYVDSLRVLDPAAPLSHGLSRGTAAEGVALALGALVGGAVVTVAGPAHGGDGAFSGYGIAALAGALAALAYLAAVAALVDEPRQTTRSPDNRTSTRRRVAEIFATARKEAAASVAVRVVLVTGMAMGMSFTAVELLWQPRLADLLGETDTNGLAFGALAASAMLAVALGAAGSPRANRRLGLRLGYLVALGFAAVCVATLGAAQSAIAFAALYLFAYLGLGIAEPMHFELLNDAVGPTARATLISAESLGTQGGALATNIGIGTLASNHGPAAAWALAGALLALTTLAVAVPLQRGARATSA